jgi:hypothetical protein
LLLLAPCSSLLFSFLVVVAHKRVWCLELAHHVILKLSLQC